MSSSSKKESLVYRNLCTFALSSEQLLLQDIYVCETCHTGNSFNCCCYGCAVRLLLLEHLSQKFAIVQFYSLIFLYRCHESHEVHYLATGRAFCDCGHSGCDNYRKNSEEVATSLLPSQQPLMSDKDGRLGGTNESNLKIDKFSVHKINISNELIINQCRELVQRSKDTFWLSTQDMNNPQCALEQLAGIIFSYHTRGASYDVSRSGAEWWVQLKDTSNQDTAEIDLHYDKDENIAELFNIGLFPQISTVTYLDSSQLSQPTIILNNTTSSPQGTPIDEMYISFPETSKHISFDGRYLHGAPIVPSINLLRKLCRNSPTASHDRVTFLVNIWIHHIPSEVQRLPPQIAKKLPSSDQFLNNSHSLSSLIQPCKQELSVISILGKESRVSRYKRTGEWVTIPFLGEKTTLGTVKTDEEETLSLNAFIPSISKLKRRISDRDAIVDSVPDTGTFLIHYADRNCCARLDREEDSHDEGVDQSV